MGIAQERSLTYGTGNVADAMVAYSTSSTKLRGAVAGGMSHEDARAASAYSPAQRAAAAGPADADATASVNKPKLARPSR